MHRRARASAEIGPVKTSPLRRTSLPALLFAGAALTLCGCNTQKLADALESHESHFPSGQHDARGGVSYSTTTSSQDWSRTISTCHSDTVAGQTTIHFGAIGGETPLTITQDSTGPTTLQLNTPDGLLTFNRSTCDALKAAPIPDTHITPFPGDTGNIIFDCTSGNKSIRGRVLFHKCGQ